MTKLTIEATQGSSIIENGSTSQVFLLLSVMDDKGRPFAGLKLTHVKLASLSAPSIGAGDSGGVVPVAIEATSVSPTAGSDFYALGIKPSAPSGSLAGGRYVVGLTIEKKSGGATLGGGSSRPLVTHAGQTIVAFRVTGD